MELIVCHVFLGMGRSLFSEKSQALDLGLQKTQAFDRGAVLLAYQTA